MQYLQYYDCLSWRGLKYHHYWLIVIIEAAWYCESRREKYIQFNPLKVKCNEALKRLTRGEISSIPDGSFASIIHSGKYKKFFTVKPVEVKSKKGTWITETRIHPHIAEIQEEIKSRQMENLDNGNEMLVRIDNKLDRITRHRPIYEPHVQVSGSVARQTSKTRAPPNESISISDRLGMVVTRSNQKKEASK